MAGIFHEEIWVLAWENCYCLLLTVCYLMLSVGLNFVVQLVLYSSAQLLDRHQIYLSDMTGGQTVFWEVNPFPNDRF